MSRRQKNECIAKLKDGKYLIIYICANSKELKIPLGVKTNSDVFKNGQFTAKWGKDYKEMNKWLQGKKNKYNELLRQADGVNAVEYIKDCLNKEKIKNDEIIIKKNSTIAEAFYIHIQKKKSRDRNSISERSFDRYESEYKRICEFDIKTTLSNLSMDWINNFVEWLATPRKKTFKVVDGKNEREYSATKQLKATNSTIHRFLQDLITFCKVVNKSFPEIDFPLEDMEKLKVSLSTNSDDPRNIVAMSQDELNAFRAHKENLKFQWQIDTYNAFMVGCLTGLRNSDIRLLSKSYINNSDEIVMNLEKTDVWVNIPLRSEVKEILDYYGGSLVGKIPTIQRLNINLRKILSQITIFQRMDIKYSYNLQEKKPHEVKRYTRFKFHSSRKTFITLAMRSNASFPQIKLWTGISDYRTLNFYMESQTSTLTDRQILTF